MVRVMDCRYSVFGIRVYNDTGNDFAATSELIKEHFTLKVHGTLCMDPVTALSESTNLPAAVRMRLAHCFETTCEFLMVALRCQLVQSILVDYVGPFVASGDRIKGVRMAALRPKHHRRASSSLVEQLMEQANKMGEDLTEQASSWASHEILRSPYVLGGAVIAVLAAAIVASTGAFSSSQESG